MAVRSKAATNGSAAGGGNAGAGLDAFMNQAAKVEAIYNKARETTNSFGNDNNQQIPEGVYSCKLVRVQVGATQQGKGKPYVSHNWRIEEEGSYKGEEFSIFRTVDVSKKEAASKGFEMLCQDTQRFGMGTKEASLRDVVEFWSEMKTALEKGELQLNGAIRWAPSKKTPHGDKWPNLQKVTRDGGGEKKGGKKTAKAK